MGENEDGERPSARTAAVRTCADCNNVKPEEEFSATQLRKRPGFSRCSNCVGSSVGSRGSNGSGRGGGGPSWKYNGPPTLLEISPRPQIPVPGFGHAPDVTVCTDWPRTKNGKPPSAQSAVFMPLLACALGPIEEHCTSEQLELAMRWWTAALPAWSRWVQELRSAGVAERKDELLRSAKGQPNPLIPKTKGRGTVPHFRGKVQTRLLEEAGGGMLSIELYACVTCLYSCSTFVEEGEEDKR